MTEQLINERLLKHSDVAEILSGQKAFPELEILDQSIQESWNELSPEAKAVAIICAEEISGYQEGLWGRSERD